MPPDQPMDFIARFHVDPGNVQDFADALSQVARPTRAENGCLAFAAFRGSEDACLFYIHSQWQDEAAFETHSQLPHTIGFLARAQRLVDQPIQTSRLWEVDR
jgi:quinol monooxygenase YgiN